MAKLYNLVRVGVGSTGTGTLTLAGALPGFLTFAQAGASSGDTVSYGIIDSGSCEIGTGTYTVSGSTVTLTRSVTKSTNSNNAISVGSGAVVYSTARAEDFGFPSGDDGQALGSASSRWSDLFLASGGVINWAAGNVTVTHSTGTLTQSGSLVVSGQVQAQQGAANSPSFHWGGSIGNTGLYSPGANIGAACASGAEIFRWNSSGLECLGYIQAPDDSGFRLTSALVVKRASGLHQFFSSDGVTPVLQVDGGSVNTYLDGTTIHLRSVGGAATYAQLTSSGFAVKTGALGYGTGVGGTVTQETSRTTGVTLNKICGQITLVSAAGSATPASFTVTNSTVATADTIILNQDAGTDKYILLVTAVGAGSFEITFYTTGGTTTEQPVINFSVIKAVTS